MQPTQRVNLCIPGSEMPRSMVHKNCGSSIESILLKHEHALIGLSLCAVVSTQDFETYFTLPLINCEANFKDRSGQSFEFSFGWSKPMFSYRDIRDFNSKYVSHVLSWYESFKEEKSFVEASFRFNLPPAQISVYFVNIRDPTAFRYPFIPQHGTWPVVECGVDPIYRQ